MTDGSVRCGVLAIDVDGTLCQRGMRPTWPVIDAVRRAAAEGWHVLLCTGRQFVGIEDLVDELGLAGPHVVSDGSVVVQSDGTELVRRTLPSAALARAVRAARKYEVTAILGGQGATAAERWNSDIDYMLTFGDPEPGLVADLSRQTDIDPTIALFVDRHNGTKLEALQLALQRIEGIWVHRSAPGYLAAVPSGSSKGNGLREALHMLSSETRLGPLVAIGDSFNDIPMFSAADVAIAMGGSSPEVQSVAAHIVPTVEEDGVAVAIEALLSGKYDVTVQELR